MNIEKRGIEMSDFPDRVNNEDHPFYRIWCGMKSRCYNPKSHAYHNYGGRGIRVCREWKDDFWQFVSDMGERPSDKHSLDRINNNGGYSHTNCKWSTNREQCWNMRKSHGIETARKIREYYSTHDVLVLEVANKFGIPRVTASKIINNKSYFDEGYQRRKKLTPREITLRTNSMRNLIVGEGL